MQRRPQIQEGYKNCCISEAVRDRDIVTTADYTKVIIISSIEQRGH